MSTTAAANFCRHVHRMPTLQAELACHVHDGAIDYDALASLGSKSGFDFTADEARTVLSGPDEELVGFRQRLASGGFRPAGAQR